MSFKRINGENILGTKAYFTGFSHKVLEQCSDLKSAKKDIERSLKVLLLTKNAIVSGASVITSDFAYSFFQEHPILLEERMIIPALHTKKKSVGDYVDRLQRKGKTEMVQFYNNRISQVVSWEEKETTDWFNNVFLKGFQEEHSVILQNLKEAPAKSVKTFIEKIQNDIEIEEAISIFQQKEQNIIKDYQNLIYHISGARVVHCESSLPQENYIDYSLADIKERKTILSEVQIFWKIFLELFFETINKPQIPIEILDMLSFKDIQDIRTPLLEMDFLENYNKLIDKSIFAVKNNDPNKLILNIDELFEIKEKIIFYFNEVFNIELKNFSKSKKILSKERIKNNFNINLTFSNFPEFSDVLKSSTSNTCFLFNVSEGLNTVRAISHKKKIEWKQEVLTRSIEKIGKPHEKNFLKVIELLIASLNDKLIR